jgi:hypothetical protein
MITKSNNSHLDRYINSKVLILYHKLPKGNRHELPNTDSRFTTKGSKSGTIGHTRHFRNKYLTGAVAEAAANIEIMKSESLDEWQDEDEESDKRMSPSDDLASKDVGNKLGTIPFNNKSAKELEVKDIRIPNTPGDELKSITLDSENRVGSPSLDIIKAFGKELGGSAEDSTPRRRSLRSLQNSLSQT